MTPFRVVVTETADRHLKTVHAWWTANRQDVPLLFAEEIEAAFDRISQAPYSGALYSQTNALSDMRRVLLRRTRYHVYYTCDAEGGRVVVRAVWHATRGRGPRLA